MMYLIMSNDAFAILERLDSVELRDRLSLLERERSAIIVLLRAALAHDRKGRGRQREASAVTRKKSRHMSLTGEALT